MQNDVKVNEGEWNDNRHELLVATYPAKRATSLDRDCKAVATAPHSHRSGDGDHLHSP